VTQTAEGAEVPTLGGLLTFGIYPQQFFPQLNITFIAYPDTQAGVPGPRGERFIDNRSIDGNIATMLRTTIEHLRRHMKRRGIVQGLVRLDEWEYPTEVLREAIVNALVHRDYSPMARGSQVQVELYPDRLTVRNAGGIYGPVDEARLGFDHTTSSRNAALLKILEDAEAEAGRTVCENRGSGLAAMRTQLNATGMRPPSFADHIATFELTLFNETLLDQPTLDWISSLNVGPMRPSQLTSLGYLHHQGGTLNNTTYRAVTGIADSRQASKELRDLVERRVLTQVSGRGSSVYRLQPERADTLASRILDALVDADLSRAQLADVLNEDAQAIASTLVLLRKTGKVELIGAPRLKTSRWRLANAGGQQDPEDHQPTRPERAITGGGLST
jgi:ATP-dependent DNA helicase RecG